MKFKHFFLLPAMLFLATTLYSQVGIGTTDPSQAAMLEISSQTNGTGDYKGFMPPRVPDEAARDQIPVFNTDDGLMVYVKDIGCIQIWDGNSWKDGFCSNYRPVAINVDFEGSLYVNHSLEASFTYYDAEGDPEGAHVYQWYRATNDSGTSATAILGATSSIYELVAADTDKYIAVSITPVAISGTSPGIPVFSSYQGPIILQPLASNLFISEYVEGSVENRAIEIANYTGSPKNLSNYRLGYYSNGSNTFTNIPLTNGIILNNGEVYVIKHNSADLILFWDQSAILNYNGDDAVALRTSTGTIIDLLGEIGVRENFGEDKTLRKKPATGSSTTYDAGDYDSFPMNTFNGLGSHQY